MEADTEVIARGDRVRQILENETFKEEVEAFLDIAKEAWLLSEPHEWEPRENLHAQANALRVFLAHMEGAVTAAELEKDRLEKRARGGIFQQTLRGAKHG
jgi:hypothetical protein